MENFPPLVLGSFLTDALRGEAEEYFQAVAEELAVVVKRFHAVCLQLSKDSRHHDNSIRALRLASLVRVFEVQTACDYFYPTKREFEEGDADHKVLPSAIRKALDGDLFGLMIGDMRDDWISFVTSLRDWAVKTKDYKRIKLSLAWAHSVVLASDKCLLSLEKPSNRINARL